MKRTYYFGKSFGPVASFSGMIIFIAGLIATYHSYSGIILVIFGSFVGFTNSSTTIDPVNKRIRHSTNIFGVIKIGKWLRVDKNMRLAIKKDNKVYRTYSRSNRVLDIKSEARVIYLCDEHGNILIPVMKIKKDEYKPGNTGEISADLGLARIVPEKNQQPI
jgi:hypothetical protein